MIPYEAKVLGQVQAMTDQIRCEPKRDVLMDSVFTDSSQAVFLLVQMRTAMAQIEFLGTVAAVDLAIREIQDHLWSLRKILRRPDEMKIELDNESVEFGESNADGPFERSHNVE